MANYSAKAYDSFMMPLEGLGLPAWRRELLCRVDLQPPVLEVGVGTGASLQWYSGQRPLIAVERVADMARAAQKRAAALGSSAAVGQMDVQALAFPDAAFASVVAFMVFCSVADPLRGLRQVRRVLRPGGRLYLLEHVRPSHPLLGRLVDVLNAPWYAFNGECNLNRRTADNVAAAGFTLESVEKRWGGIANLIVARA
jgi:phosphatidylethanolamine/phosphatidyl-N-methylethanolamine N-methyltransferase